MPDPRTSRLVQISRGLRLIGKLSKGLILVSFVFPRIRPVQRDRIIERWCREVLEVLSIHPTLEGDIPSGRVSSVLFVANHISWVDVLVLNACRRVRFVAKVEVSRWPLIGRLSAGVGTIFLRRTSSRDLARVTKRVIVSLRRGHCVALFPEGTTTDGTTIRSFHSGLFEAAVMAEALIWPVAIRYRHIDGTPDAGVAFIGDQSLVSSILNILARPSIHAQLSFVTPVEGTGGDRRELTAWCQRVIARTLTGHGHAHWPQRLSLPVPGGNSLPPLPAA